jgi:D-3-phosphoglycerate dehydrogenase
LKLVIADALPASAVDLLREPAGWEVEVRAGRPRAEVIAALSDADALLVRSATRVDAELLAAAPRLKVVARAGIGVDNVDLDAASARGVLVMNAPGANSISVAEHACALMLALARAIPAADAAMKAGRWDKRRFTGAELHGKVLGLVGFGRIGREVAHRAQGFGMRVVAHDPFIAAQVAADAGVELVQFDELCRQADYLSLHLPSTPATRRLFDAGRFARCKPGVRLINTARGDLVDEGALADAITAGIVGGAALDVFEVEPPRDWRLASLPQVIATPHIAASTAEAQELVGVETATAVRDFLLHGVVRNAVNFPSIPAEEFQRLQPYLTLAERLGSLLAQMGEARIEAVGVRYYGAAGSGSTDLIASAVLVGVFRTILSSAVTLVNARALAVARGIEIVESRSSRPRNFTSLMSVKLHTSEGERWVEGTVFEPGSPRLVLVGGVEVEAPLEGTLLVIQNADQPGVIGEVGTILGRHAINIANFALGRGPAGAVGVVNVDENRPQDAAAGEITSHVLAEIAAVPAVREVRVIRL